MHVNEIEMAWTSSRLGMPVYHGTLLPTGVESRCRWGTASARVRQRVRPEGQTHCHNATERLKKPNNPLLKQAKAKQAFCEAQENECVCHICHKEVEFRLKPQQSTSAQRGGGSETKDRPHRQWTAAQGRQQCHTGGWECTMGRRLRTAFGGSPQLTNPCQPRDHAVPLPVFTQKKQKHTPIAHAQ